MPTRTLISTAYTFDGANNTTSRTIPVGTLVLEVSVVTISSGVDQSGVTCGGQAMTKIGTGLQHSGGKPRVNVWRLINPPTGAQNIVVTHTGGSDKTGVAVFAWTDIDTTTPFDGWATAQGTSTTPSRTVVSATGDRVADTIADLSTQTLAPGAGQTELVDFMPTDGRMGCSHEDGAASVTMSWTVGESKEWVSAGWNANAPAGGGAEIEDTLVNSAQSSQSFTNEQIASVLLNSAQSVHAYEDFLATIVLNSAESRQGYSAWISTPSGIGVHTLDEEISTGEPSQIAETVSNSASSTQSVISAEAQDSNNAGTSSFVTADSIAETHTTSSESLQSIFEEIHVTETISNSAENTQTTLSALAEDGSSSGSGTQSSSDATAETTISTGTSSISITEDFTGVIEDTLASSSTGIHALTIEALAETESFTSTSDQAILTADSESAGNSGTGTNALSDATAEAVTHSSASTYTQLEAEAQDVTNEATSIFAVDENVTGGGVTDIVTNEATSIHTLGIEATFDSEDNVSSNTHSISSAEAESPENEGSSDSITSDATAEMLAQMATALYSLDEMSTVSIFEIIDAPGYHMEFGLVVE